MKNKAWVRFFHMVVDFCASMLILALLLALLLPLVMKQASSPNLNMPPPPSPLATPNDSGIIIPNISQDAEIAAISKALAQLNEGSFFHNVPAEMEVGVPVTIESGIAIDDVKEVLERNNISGEFLTETEVRYDPLGTELELIAPSDAFSKEVISAGRKTILSDDEPVWSWRVIPKRAGQHLIIIKVKVNLASPLTGEVYPKEFTTFREQRLVKVNYAHSIQSFISENWKELLTRLIGPGTVFGLGAWLVNSRRLKELERKRQPAGFIGEALKNSGKRK